MLVNFLAELWGISLVVASLALIINPKYLKKLFESAQDDQKLFCLSMMSFVIGLAMILSYNVWVKSWTVVITVLGWLALIKGLALLFMPEIAKTWVRKIESASFLPYALIAALLVGLALTYLGFTA